MLRCVLLFFYVVIHLVPVLYFSTGNYGSTSLFVMLWFGLQEYTNMSTLTFVALRQLRCCWLRSEVNTERGVSPVFSFLNNFERRKDSCCVVCCCGFLPSIHPVPVLYFSTGNYGSTSLFVMQRFGLQEYTNTTTLTFVDLRQLRCCWLRSEVNTEREVSHVLSFLNDFERRKGSCCVVCCCCFLSSIHPVPVLYFSTGNYGSTCLFVMQWFGLQEYTNTSTLTFVALRQLRCRCLLNCLVCQFTIRRVPWRWDANYLSFRNLSQSPARGSQRSSWVNQTTCLTV